MIAIARRLSTIARVDRLIVLDAGRIVEQGRHEELLRGDGPCAMLWRHQSGGFLPHEVTLSEDDLRAEQQSEPNTDEAPVRADAG